MLLSVGGDTARAVRNSDGLVEGMVFLKASKTSETLEVDLKRRMVAITCSSGADRRCSIISTWLRSWFLSAILTVSVSSFEMYSQTVPLLLQREQGRLPS